MQSVGTSNPSPSPILEPLLEGVFIVAVIAMLTWMTKQSRAMKGEIEGSLANLLDKGKKASLGIFGLILFAILREGFEVVLFISAKFQEGFMPALGAVSGIALIPPYGFSLKAIASLKQFVSITSILPENTPVFLAEWYGIAAKFYQPKNFLG